MKISILENGFNIGVDYSKRKDCLGVFEITEEQKAKLEKGANYSINGDELEIIEDKKYLANIQEEEKQSDIQKFKTLEKKATETRSEYLTAELLPEGDFKTRKLENLEAKRIDITAEYEAVMQELINKYGEGIVEKIL